MENKKENEIDLTEPYLNQHLALLYYEMIKGDSLGLNAEKTMLILLKHSQDRMKDRFLYDLRGTLKDIGISKKEEDIIIKNFYKRKNNKIKSNIDLKAISQKKILKISETISELHLELLNKFHKTSFTFEKLKKIDFDKIEKDHKYDLEDLFSRKSYQIFNGDDPEEEEEITKELMEEMIEDIIEYHKKVVSEEFAEPQGLNYTNLCNLIGLNRTRLKKELELIKDINVRFDYYDRFGYKNDVITGFFNYFKVKGKYNHSVLIYEIPRPVLELLILPEFYVPLDVKRLLKCTSKYTIRLYSILKKYVKDGYRIMSKDELKDLLNLKPTHIKDKSKLEEKVLDIAKKDLEEIGMKISYEFNKQKKWDTIKFNIEEVNKNLPKIKEVYKFIEKDPEYEFAYEWDEEILKAIEKAKRNIYVSKSWNKRADNKIEKIDREDGRESVLFILKTIYENLNDDIKKSLVQYINGIIKNLRKESKYPISKKKVETSSNDEIEEAVIVEEPGKGKTPLKVEHIPVVEVSEVVPEVAKVIENLEQATVVQKKLQGIEWKDFYGQLEEDEKKVVIKKALDIYIEAAEEDTVVIRDNFHQLKPMMKNIFIQKALQKIYTDKF